MKGQIKAKCSSCNRYSTFTYVGTQKDLTGVPLFDLYNCEHCDSSRAFNFRDKTLEKKIG